MSRHLLISILTLMGLVTATVAQEPPMLPKPQYQREASDPEWLALAVQLHGHLGPWIVAGVRLGAAARIAVEAHGYFDVEVTCEGPFVRPPQACFLDGLQVATGATLGKGTLRWVEADRVVVRVKNTRTGKTAAVSPKPALLEMLGSLKPRAPLAESHGSHGHGQRDAIETIARRIAATVATELCDVKVTDQPKAK